MRVVMVFELVCKNLILLGIDLPRHRSVEGKDSNMKQNSYCISVAIMILLVISLPNVLSAQELQCAIDDYGWPLSAPNYIRFSLSATGGVQPLTYTLNFGDGSPDGFGTVAYSPWLLDHIYPSVGTYQATLTVTDATGISCHSSIEVIVIGMAVKESSWGKIKSMNK